MGAGELDAGAPVGGGLAAGSSIGDEDADGQGIVEGCGVLESTEHTHRGGQGPCGRVGCAGERGEREEVVRCGLGNVGVRGLVDALDMATLRDVAEEEKLNVVAVTEHFRGKYARVRKAWEMSETEEERQRSEAVLGEGWQWLERCRMGGGRGGVGLAVRRSWGVGRVMDNVSSDGMMWVRIEVVGGGLVFVGVVYMAPEQSVYVAEAARAQEMMSAGLHHIREVEGAKCVMVLGDVNGRIGETALEFEEGEGVVVVERVSDDKTVNQRGMAVLGLLQAHHMMLMNGVDGEQSGKATCRGVSVVDWMAVAREMKEEYSAMWVEEGWMAGEGGRKDKDHGWLRLDWKRVVGASRCVCVEVGGEVGVRGTDKRGRCRVRKGREDGWVSLERECKRVMKPWCEERRRAGEDGGVETAEEIAAGWLKAHDAAVEHSIGWGRVGGGKRKAGYDKEISKWSKEMREITREWMRETDDEKKSGMAAKRREVRSERQRRVRRGRSGAMMKKMKEIEKLAMGGDGESLVKALERWSGKGRAVTGGDRVKMKDGQGGWLVGTEMKKKWRDTFEEVGRRLEAEEGFDDDIKMDVEAAVDGWTAGWTVEEEVEMEHEGSPHQTTLDGDVMRWEVRRAIKRLRNGKSVGVDGVVAEVLKNGGEWMEESVWRLCVAVFREEEVPVEWLRAIKVPVKKKGVGDCFDQYRGVTLLSVVGKVFAMVVEARLRSFCESRGLLTDCQFGFRQGRSCRDPLLVVTEVMEQRGEGERVFLGFLDIAKAYPSVWRKGMWLRLWEVGVRGRMWRVVQSLYAKCEVAVRVGGEAEDWYEEFVGLREGCVLSPLLFAIYINDLPEELGRGKCGGIRMGEKVVRCLMFADDVVMMASSAAELQRCFDAVARFSVRWRFKFNFGVDKTAVMVCGGVREGERWELGGREVEVVKDYRYLGVRLMARGGWALRRKELLAKSRGAFWRAWGLGMAGGYLSPKAARGVWDTLVSPVMEYGAEVDSGAWEEAELLQRLGGRMCLGVGRGVPNVVVRGELGWWTVRARRQYLRLAYWGKVVSDPVGCVVRCVYAEGRERVQSGRASKGEWCVETRRLLVELGLGEVWETEAVGDVRGWKAMVKALMQEKEEMRWRQEMAGLSTLGRYMRVKRSLKAEWFLGEARVWVRRWVRLRASATCLEVSVGRRRGVFLDRRVCGWCSGGVVEDEEHFLDGCGGWGGSRRALWDELREGDRQPVKRVEEGGREGRVDWMVEGGG